MTTPFHPTALRVDVIVVQDLNSSDPYEVFGVLLRDPDLTKEQREEQAKALILEEYRTMSDGDWEPSTTFEDLDISFDILENMPVLLTVGAKVLQPEQQ